MKYIPTTEKVTVEDYPYGFTLRTTLYDFIEFDQKKGYRHCTQTINPKTGLLNKPKKSTYSALIVRYYNEDNHIKALHFEPTYSNSGFEKCRKFVYENFELFTVAEITYIYSLLLVALKVSMVGYYQYSGSKLDDLKPLFAQALEECRKGIKEPTINYFGFQLDLEAIEATKEENYQPFKVTSYETN